MTFSLDNQDIVISSSIVCSPQSAKFCFIKIAFSSYLVETLFCCCCNICGWHLAGIRVLLFCLYIEFCSHIKIQLNLLKRTSHKADTSLKRTLSHVPAERRCISHRKTDNCKTDTSIRRTLSHVPMVNFHCKLPLKTDTSNLKDEFYTE